MPSSHGDMTEGNASSGTLCGLVFSNGFNLIVMAPSILALPYRVTNAATVDTIPG